MSIALIARKLVSLAAFPRNYQESKMNQDIVDQYLVPIDPMDLLQCDSCQ